MGEVRNRIDGLLLKNGGAPMGVAGFRKEMLDKIMGAMREASPAMIEAGNGAIARARSQKKKVTAPEVWRAMIDAA